MKKFFSIDAVVPLLEQEVRNYEVPVVDLIAAQTKDPFKVLVATILSARTKDEVTAAASRRLFAKVDNAATLARLSIPEIEKLIFPVGFFRNKAKYLAELPGALTERFSGKVPETIDDLVTLPGVGRKTANLVVAIAFQKPAICVDTHVHRIMNIWGYVDTQTPLQTEMALREKLPQKYWIRINSLLVAFGQGTCTPLRPHCDRCVLAEYCPQIGVTPRKIHQDASGEKKMASAETVLLSWNVNGLRAAVKNGFVGVVQQLQPDIVALQEIKAHPEQVPEVSQELAEAGYQGFWFPAQKKGYSGTAVFTRMAPEQVYYGMEQPEFDAEGRVLTLEYAGFYLLDVYSPNAQPELKRLDFKEAFNKALLDYMNRLRQQKTVVVCGDLNVAHKEIDLANPKANVKNPGFSPEERAWMDTVLDAGYVDTFRSLHPEPGQYTWWSYRFNARAKNIGWRIDYFLVDAASRERVVDASIHNEVTGSDHCPVGLILR